MTEALTSLQLHSVTWVREREGYSPEVMMWLFGVAADEWPDLRNRLLTSNILRCKNKTVTEDENPLDYIRGNGEYAFGYVGVLCHRGRLIYVLPKYLTEYDLKSPQKNLPDSAMDQLALVLKVVQTYKNKYERTLRTDASEKESDSYLARLVTLLADYAENGEYRDEEHVINLNSPGRIMWNRTINATTPYMQGDEPIYADTYNRRLVDAEDNFITRLHRVAVKECSQKLQQFNLPVLLKLPVVDAIEEDLEELGNLEYLRYRVESELGCQFDSRRRHILHLLDEYLNDRCNNAHSPEDTYTFGSTGFHQIWEDVCRSTLGKDIRKDFAIAPPVWSLDGSGKTPVQSLQLDMLFKEGETGYVMDAKYYVPYECNGTIHGLPGVGDVTKQFLYRQAVMSEAALTLPNRKFPGKVYNAFLLPMPNDREAAGPVQHYASVTMGLFPNSRIDTFLIAPEILYRAYAQGFLSEVRHVLQALLREQQTQPAGI